MKTIPLPFPVPDWAEWVAQDLDGDWCGFEAEPNPVVNRWRHDSGLCVHIGTGAPNPNWRETLRKV